MVDGTENLSDHSKQLDNHQDNNTAFLNKTRLEGKSASKNVINLSKRNLFRSEISQLSKGLKFVPSSSFNPRNRELYEEVPNDPSVLVKTIIKALEKIRFCGDLPSDTLNYFAVEDPKFARFYLLQKIHKRLYNVPGSNFKLRLLHWEHIFVFRLPFATTCSEG